MLKTKTFDCVEMKREGTRRIYELTRGMTPEQELAFWKKRDARLEHRMKAARARTLVGSK